MKLHIFGLNDGAFVERPRRWADAEMEIPECASQFGNGRFAGCFGGFIFEKEEEVNVRIGEKHPAAVTPESDDTALRRGSEEETMLDKLGDNGVGEPATLRQRPARVARGIKRPADARGFVGAELREVGKRNDGRHANSPGASSVREILQRVLTALVVADTDGFIHP